MRGNNPAPHTTVRPLLRAVDVFHSAEGRRIRVMHCELNLWLIMKETFDRYCDNRYV